MHPNFNEQWKHPSVTYEQPGMLTMIASLWNYFCVMFTYAFFASLIVFSQRMNTFTALHSLELSMPSNGLLPPTMHHRIPCHSWTSNCLPVCWAITPTPLSVHSAASLHPIRNLGDNVFLQTASKDLQHILSPWHMIPLNLPLIPEDINITYLCHRYIWINVYIHIAHMHPVTPQHPRSAILKRIIISPANQNRLKESEWRQCCCCFEDRSGCWEKELCGGKRKNAENK